MSIGIIMLQATPTKEAKNNKAFVVASRRGEEREERKEEERKKGEGKTGKLDM